MIGEKGVVASSAYRIVGDSGAVRLWDKGRPSKMIGQ